MLYLKKSGLEIDEEKGKSPEENIFDQTNKAHIVD